MNIFDVLLFYSHTHALSFLDLPTYNPLKTACSTAASYEKPPYQCVLFGVVLSSSLIHSHDVVPSCLQTALTWGYGSQLIGAVIPNSMNITIYLSDTEGSCVSSLSTGSMRMRSINRTYITAGLSHSVWCYVDEFCETISNVSAGVWLKTHWCKQAEITDSADTMCCPLPFTLLPALYKASRLCHPHGDETSLSVMTAQIICHLHNLMFCCLISGTGI